MLDNANKFGIIVNAKSISPEYSKKYKETFTAFERFCYLALELTLSDLEMWEDHVVFNKTSVEMIANHKQRALIEEMIEEKNDRVSHDERILHFSQDEINTRIKNIEDEVQKFNFERKNLINEYEIKKKKDIEELMKKISPLLEEYMDQNSIDFILNFFHKFNLLFKFSSELFLNPDAALYLLDFFDNKFSRSL